MQRSGHNGKRMKSSCSDTSAKKEGRKTCLEISSIAHVSDSLSVEHGKRLISQQVYSNFYFFRLSSRRNGTRTWADDMN